MTGCVDSMGIDAVAVYEAHESVEETDVVSEGMAVHPFTIPEVVEEGYLSPSLTISLSPRNNKNHQVEMGRRWGNLTPSPPHKTPRPSASRPTLPRRQDRRRSTLRWPLFARRGTASLLGRRGLGGVVRG